MCQPGQIQEARRELVGLLDMMGLGALADHDDAAAPTEVVALLAEREDARAARDFARADSLRDAILAHGYELRDGSDGPEMYRAS